MVAQLPTISITDDPSQPLAYRCAGRDCNYSSSHDGGYGGFYYVDGRLLCRDCAAAYRGLKDGFFGR